MARRERFVVLDSLRGLCACLVTLYHLDAYSHIYNVELLRNASLFVDFFFVLSGFIIAYSYGDRLQDGAAVKGFMLRRFARLYPLHLFMLAVFVLFELMLLGISQHVDILHRDPFDEEYAVAAIPTNLLLLHSLGLHDDSTWNSPSWSISTEFYTYVLFAGLTWLTAMRRWLLAALVIAVSAPLLVLASDGRGMDLSYDFGFLRCALGFFAGVLVHEAYMACRRRQLALASRGLATVLELLALLAVGSFVVAAGNGPLGFWAPAVFGLAIAVFLWECGAVSRLLKASPFVFLGTLSYSIYMTHYFIVLRMHNAAQLAEALFDEPFVTAVPDSDGDLYRLLGVELWQGDFAYILLMAMVLPASYLVWRFIEEPARRAINLRAARRA